MKKIAVLGSTGSIGRNTLKIILDHPDEFKAVSLSAGSNVELLAQQIDAVKPQVASLKTREDAEKLSKLGDFSGTRITWGEDGMSEVACFEDAEIVVSSVVGAAGLVPTWKAIEAGKDIALANKETLVTAGALFMDKVKEKSVRLIPVDSEHSAIFQSLEGHNSDELSKILLTASGGPFRENKDNLAAVTPEMALAHPNWSMGAKISIDSATLMNKGLEVIEARWLFDTKADKIEVVVHPESIIHSMVEFIDGQIIAQLGVPDMKGPIAYALSYPKRLSGIMKQLDLKSLQKLSFYEPDTEAFPCLKLAFEALAGPDSAPTALNAANEIAVAAFLDSGIGFLDIPATISHVLETMEHQKLSDIEQVIEIDRKARELAQSFVNTRGAK